MKKQYIRPQERELSVDTRMIAAPSAGANPSVVDPGSGGVVNPSKSFDIGSGIWSNMNDDDPKGTDTEE